MKVLLVVLLSLILISTNGQDRSKYLSIKSKMKDLSFFVGTWKANTVFNNKDGSALKSDRTESGTYKISWDLDSCYLRWDIELKNNGSGKKRFMLILMTYNPGSDNYELNYFYNGSSLRVFETGKLSKDKGLFSTTAFIPLEDGVRDENVRTETWVKSPKEITYVHYSKYNNEEKEWNDFSASMSRIIQ